MGQQGQARQVITRLARLAWGTEQRQGFAVASDSAPRALRGVWPACADGSAHKAVTSSLASQAARLASTQGPAASASSSAAQRLPVNAPPRTASPAAPHSLPGPSFASATSSRASQPQLAGIRTLHTSPGSSPRATGLLGSPTHSAARIPLLAPRPPKQLPCELSTRRGFIDFRRIQYEFFSPDRQMTSTFISISVVLTLASFMSKRLFWLLVQSHAAVYQGQWWRLITTSFLHAGILHLLPNMLALHYLGGPVEELLNKTSYAIVYLSGVLGGSLAAYYYGSAQVVLGSSGAIAGLFAAWVVYKLRNRDVIPFTKWDQQFVLQMLALNVLLSVALSGHLSHAGHVGGLIGGGLAMFLIGPRYTRVHGRVVNQPLIPWLRHLP